jgi:NAD dependent epimerase/dehydratase family
MSTLLCLGLGYTAAHYVARHGSRFERAIGTVRTPKKAAALSAAGIGGRPVETIVFDGNTASDRLAAAVETADALLVSVPPSAHGDPVPTMVSAALARRARAPAIVYLSTVGVYGNHDGGFVDETQEPRPISARSMARLAAELAWQEIGHRTQAPVAVLRLAGIYGPGRNALRNLIEGTAKRIVKPGQVFNRIHADDIGAAIDAAFVRRAGGIVNVADDHPAPPQDVVAFAAGLLGLAPPPEIPFAQAAKTMTAMALSFFGENKRVRNDRLKAEWGVRLLHPTFRDGLRALHAAGDHLRVPHRPPI